jgi:hypothetical protein
MESPSAARHPSLEGIAPTALSGRTRTPYGAVGAVVLQVDATVSRCHGLAWLIAQREASLLTRLSALYAEGKDEGWSPDDFTRARLATLRPRRAEINRLGRAYLDELAPGVIDAAHRMRRAGIAVELSSEVAIEALFPVAAALGITPAALHGPSLRFDALGAYRGCDVKPRILATERERDLRDGQPRTLYVGTAQSDLAIDAARELFLSFTGFVTVEGKAPASDSIASFDELAALVAA